jgi:hypothetical protein
MERKLQTVIFIYSDDIIFGGLGHQIIRLSNGELKKLHRLSPGDKFINDGITFEASFITSELVY